MRPDNARRARASRATAALALLALLLSACAQYAAVKDEPRRIGNVYTVDPQIAWDSMKDGKAEIWTVDGPLLESVRFVTGIAEAEPIFQRPGGAQLPNYRKHMTEPEIAELVAGNLSGLGHANVTTSALQPAAFGALQGFRFDIAFTDADGLDWRGLVVGAQDGDKLHLVIYSGTALHYYGRYIDTVERLIASIRT